MHLKLPLPAHQTSGDSQYVFPDLQYRLSMHQDFLRINLLKTGLNVLVDSYLIYFEPFSVVLPYKPPNLLLCLMLTSNDES